VNYRHFGRTNWQVSEIGYGMWGMGGWTGSDDEESLASLQRAVDLGCNFFDTPGRTVKDEARRCWANWCARTRIKSCIRPPRCRPKIRPGPAGANLPSTIHFRLTTSSNACTKVWSTQDYQASISFSFTFGKTVGWRTIAGRRRLMSCARRDCSRSGYQHQSLGTLERREGGPQRSDRRRSGHL
jgi:hypothetical protein